MSANEREELLEAVALYALGVLPAPDAAAVRAAIERDGELRAEYDSLRGAVDAVGLVAEEPVDSARTRRMRERLMARVRADAATNGRQSEVRSLPRRPMAVTTPIWVRAAGLAAAAAIVISVITVAQDVGLRGELAAVQRRNAALQAQVAQADRAGAQDRRVLTDLLAPDARRYEVAQGTVVVRGDRLYLALSRLPAPPKGHVYEAWTAVKGSTQMQPSVTFVPNADGVAVVALPVDAGRIGVVAVSVEPEGGSKAPTTKPSLVRPLT